VDQTDTAHISFSDYNIVYGTYSSVPEPPVEDVDSHHSYMSSLAIDSEDKPHRAYCSEYYEYFYDYTNYKYNHDLRYAIKTGGTWTSTVVYTFPNVPSEYHYCKGALSLALDKSGVAHIVFSDNATYPSLQYATNQGGAWTVSALNTNFEINVIETIVVDTNGKVHMVFWGSDYKPRYAHNIAGDWTVDVINETSIYNLSLVLDEAGKAHISYASDNPPRFRYATNASGAWNKLLIGTVPSAEAARNGIALDPEGNVHIVYYYGTGSNSGDHILKYATISK
jgi:hypothetical protein